MSLKRILILFIFLVIPVIFVSGQDALKDPPKAKNKNILERMDFGGYIGAQFGSVIIVDVSPLARYFFTEKFYGGLGLTYMYFKDNRYSPSISLSSYGGSLFAGYYIWRDLFAHVEYAPLYTPNFYDYYMPYLPGDDMSSPWAHDFLIGGGYRQWLGGKAFVNLMILFNLNETVYSPYSNPIIRIGFGAGI